MSGFGTSLVAFRVALVDRLIERPGLSGVDVLYDPNEREYGDEALWLREAETEELEIASLRAGKLHLQETYDVEVVAQVTLTQGQTQRQADTRLVEIYAELQQQLAEMPQIVEDIQWAKPHGWKYRGGKLGSGSACRFEIKVRVHARME